MDTTTLMLYIIAATAATITPGPTMLLALHNGANRGMRVAACGIAGAALSDVILITAVGCGLGSLLLASEYLFTLLKWAGSIYLLYLAWQLWHAAPVFPTSTATSAISRDQGWAAFRRSLLVALSNPKGLLFFSAFLPQFIQPQISLISQYLTLALVTALIDIAAMGIYAAGGHHTMRMLTARTLRQLNRSCAAILACLAIALSLYRRSATQ